MADVSFHRQPQNPSAFDWHALYGGRLDDAGVLHGNGHFQVVNGEVLFHRPSVEHNVGQLAARGQMDPT